MANKRKVHLDATKHGDAVHMARCGWPAVDTETDITKVTCELCKRHFLDDVARLAKPANDNPLPAKKTKGKPITRTEFASELEAPGLRRKRHKAGPPPRLTAPTWASICRGSYEERRCGHCVVCAHERDMDQALEESLRQKVHTLHRPDRAPKWGSLNAALVALAEYEAHERTSPSAMGFMLARVARGDVSNDNGASRPDDPQLARADDVVHVRQALAVAYPEGAHKILTARQCMVVLLARTPGAQPGPEIAYEAMAERLSVSIGDLKALVKEGRRRATVELAARGLIPQPPPSAGLAEAVWMRGRRAVNG